VWLNNLTFNFMAWFITGKIRNEKRTALCGKQNTDYAACIRNAGMVSGS
jgi:hypothetical protein